MRKVQKQIKKKEEIIEIREMEIKDLYQVFQLGEKIFTSEDVPNLYRTWDEFELVSLFQDESDACLVAERNERIVGFILGTTVQKSRSAWNYGYLVWLGVDPNYQHEGIASRLFFHFRNKMLEKGMRMLLVDTQADNDPAIHFFQKVGFSNPEEHVYMTLNLAEEQKQRKHKKKNHK